VVKRGSDLPVDPGQLHHQPAYLSTTGCTFRDNFISSTACNGLAAGGAIYVKQEQTTSEVKLSILGTTFAANRAPASGCPGSAIVTSKTSDTAPKLTVTLTGSKFTSALCVLSVFGGERQMAHPLPFKRGCQPGTPLLLLFPAADSPATYYTPSFHPTNRRQLSRTGGRLWCNPHQRKQRCKRCPAAPQFADNRLQCHLVKHVQQLLRCGCHGCIVMIYAYLLMLRCRE